MLITHGNSVLMGRSPHWPEGMFSLLAGFVEPGETIEAAVRREVWEEAGVKVGAVDYLASQPWAFPASLMFGCRGVALSREITIDPVEIEQAMWVSREEMMQAFSGAHPVLSPARKRCNCAIFAAQLVGGYAITPVTDRHSKTSPGAKDRTGQKEEAQT